MDVCERSVGDSNPDATVHACADMGAGAWWNTEDRTPVSHPRSG